MASRPFRLLVAAVYQLSLLAGILLMPVALVARQIGLPLPLDRVFRRLADAYDRVATDSS